jgi:hypothetical protein
MRKGINKARQCSQNANPRQPSHTTKVEELKRDKKYG